MLNQKHLQHIRLHYIIIALICWPLISAKSQNLRRISTREGMTSSFVTCLNQTDDGVLWIGSLDGVNVFFGQQIEQASLTKGQSTHSYLVERIINKNGHVMWIQTPHHLCRNDLTKDEVHYFQEFTGNYMTREISDNDVLVLDKSGKLSTYNSAKGKFEDAHFKLPSNEQVVNVGSTPDLFWTASRKGLTIYNWSKDNDGARRVGKGRLVYAGNITFCSQQENSDIIYFVDNEGNLYQQYLTSPKRAFIVNIKEDIIWRGAPSAIVKEGNTWFISFTGNGVLKYTFKNGNLLQKKDLGIHTGVFDMIKDRFQEIMWVATDGQGLYAYWEEAYQVRSFEYKNLCPSVGKPVRALLRGEDGRVWVGTKGDGLLVFQPTPDGNYTMNARLTSANSALNDNFIYALSPSRHSGFWVGTDDGLNFYSQASHTLQAVSAEKPIKYIHSIYEEDDSILWLATVGTGVVRAHISRNGSTMKLTDIKRFTIENGDFSSNFFFSLSPASDKGVWASNRGHGIYKISRDGNFFDSVPFKDSTPMQNDVFAVLEHDGLLWGGTYGGLVGINRKQGNTFCLDESKGMPFHIIHTLLAEKGNGVWAATNNGLVNINSRQTVSNYYSMSNGLNVYEFSDGAAFQADGTMYFGGVNGWVEVKRNVDFKPQKSFVPTVLFHSLHTADRILSLYAETQKPNDKDYRIKLKSDETSFTLDFMVVDYLNNYNYTYLYNISSTGQNGQWIDNGHFNRLSLTQLPPGNYTIALKCKNQLTGEESEERILQLYIAAPWYATIYAKLFYLLIIAVLIYFAIKSFLRSAKQKQLSLIHQMEQKHKEEVYEEKLNFFTNVTHEFCTPLTLIYSPCERILANPGTNDFIRKYVTLIMRNAERLNSLILEIIEYRRLDTHHQKATIKNQDVSVLFWDVFMSFSDLAEHNKIKLDSQVEEGLVWPTDSRCFNRILANLISNAIKYTPNGGTVRVKLHQNGNNLELKVYNTGKGIKEEDQKRIFDRYSVLADVEDSARKGLYTHNGLGLAICHSTVELLQGQISLNSVPNEYAEFVVELPQLPLSNTDEDEAYQVDQSIKPVYTLETDTEKQEDLLPTDDIQNKAVIDNRPHILVVDDNEEILFILQEALEDYHVITANSVEKAQKELKSNTPDLIVTDIMMPDIDGIEFINMVKEDKYSRQIPLIILSAKTSDKEKALGMMTGADAYITKPFSMQYLQATIARLLEKKREMKDYYNSASSSFEIVDSRLMREQDRDFVTKVKNYIQQNIANEEWDMGEMAATLNMSTRSMYRKFKELNLPPPRDYIKEIKIAQAAILLRTTPKTIKEIIFETGFSNRGHFYKEFAKRYNMPPGEYREILKKG